MTSTAALGALEEGLEKVEVLRKSRGIQARQHIPTAASAEAAAEEAAQHVRTLVAQNEKTFEEVKEMLQAVQVAVEKTPTEKDQPAPPKQKLKAILPEQKIYEEYKEVVGGKVEVKEHLVNFSLSSSPVPDLKYI